MFSRKLWQRKGEVICVHGTARFFSPGYVVMGFKISIQLHYYSDFELALRKRHNIAEHAAYFDTSIQKAVKAILPENAFDVFIIELADQGTSP